MTPLDPEAINQAAAVLNGVVKRTSLERNVRLSEIHSKDVFLKREDAQLCRSYKVRGAYNLIHSLSDDQRQQGVVCASAGNHAQGVAFACRELGIQGRIFLPTNTPQQKRQRIETIGGDWIEIVFAGNSYDEASARALNDSRATEAVYVHPFNDLRTIAGQGTVAHEFVQQFDGDFGTVVVPVGGGGLISGIATWLRSCRPDVRIVGAEPEGAASMSAAIRDGRPVDIGPVDTFVDGAAVGCVGSITFPIVRDLVDEIITVPEGAVCTEMLDMYQADGIIAEPAGALASAAIQFLPISNSDPIICVVSGGNNDVSRYTDVLERSLLYLGLRHYFLVSFAQQPGSLRGFLDDVLIDGEDIVVFEYVKKTNRDTGPALVGIDLQRESNLPALLSRMEKSPLQIERVLPGSPLFTFLH